MVALAALTHPGPFRSHTYRFGTYLGIRVDGVLAAMGGQRMHLPGYREVSAICTHPDFRGRGYARVIVARLVAAIFDEGLDPVPPRRGREPQARRRSTPPSASSSARGCRWWWWNETAEPDR